MKRQVLLALRTSMESLLSMSRVTVPVSVLTNTCMLVPFSTLVLQLQWSEATAVSSPARGKEPRAECIAGHSGHIPLQGRILRQFCSCASTETLSRGGENRTCSGNSHGGGENVCSRPKQGPEYSTHTVASVCHTRQHWLAGRPTRRRVDAGLSRGLRWEALQ